MTEENIGSSVHRTFIALHSILCTLAVFVSVSSAVVTDHWKDNIDGCILYADVSRVKNTTEWAMNGSAMSVCNYVIFTPVFFIFICCLAISFHLRHLFCQRCWRAEEGKEDFWAMLVRVLIALCGFMALLSLVLACMLTHGHDITCAGVRNYVTDQGLTPWLGITSEKIHELFDRIDCGFFYSALDYGLKIGGSDDAAIINSNAALEIAIVCAWFQFIFWVGTTAANVWLAKKMKVELTFELPRLPAWLLKQ